MSVSPRPGSRFIWFLADCGPVYLLAAVLCVLRVVEQDLSPAADRRDGDVLCHRAAASPRAASDAAKSRLMLLGVGAIVAVIVAFKAAGASTGFLLPLGISYYSFKLISYLIEVYWDEESVERDPVDFLPLPRLLSRRSSAAPSSGPSRSSEQMREVMGRAAQRPADRGGLPLHSRRPDAEAPDRRPPRRRHRQGRRRAQRLHPGGDGRDRRLLHPATLRRLRRLHKHRARDRQALRRRRPAELQRAVRGRQHPGDVASLAHELDELGDGLPFHAAVACRCAASVRPGWSSASR